MTAGFCRFCHHWLRDKSLTEHATREDCCDALQSKAAFWEEAHDREHDHVHHLEDVIAELRKQLADKV
jgi:hypothetical protein